MNFTYNATVDLMDVPIIKFQNQSEPIHRVVVFLKCFMCFALENREIDTILVHRLRNYLVACYMAITFVMVALSAELISKAVPLMMFCYACQTLKFYVLDTDARRATSYIGFIFCCIEFTGFEFIYDVYIILCFLFKSLYSLSQLQDHEQKERGELARLAPLLIFLTELGLIYNSHYIDYRFIIAVNSFMAINDNLNDTRTMRVTILYILMTKILLSMYFSGVDLDAMFDEILKRMWNCMVEFVVQFFHGA